MYLLQAVPSGTLGMALQLHRAESSTVCRTECHSVGSNSECEPRTASIVDVLCVLHHLQVQEMGQIPFPSIPTASLRVVGYGCHTPLLVEY